MEKTKKCSGCKDVKLLDNFYKNKLVLDGHSNYCIECTRDNSKKYFQRKKERIQKEQDDILFKSIILQADNLNIDPQHTENVLKILTIENMCKSMLNEITSLKMNLTKTNELISQ
jgi:hypothetical protein